MFRHLLVPIDGTPASSLAIGFAITIAKARSGTLVFCHALDMRALGMGDTVAVDPGWIESLRPEAEKVGYDALLRATAAGCSASLQVLPGIAEHVILKLAPSFDMVVIGTRAISGIRHVIQYSVTDAIVAACPCPVLVVRQSDQQPTLTPSGINWARLIAPIDGSEASESAIELTSAFAAERDWELVFVYAEKSGLAAALSMHRSGAKWLTYAEARAKAAGARVSTRLLEGSLVEAIVMATASENGDAVIIGSRGRQGFARISQLAEDLLRKSSVPILVLHARDEADA